MIKLGDGTNSDQTHFHNQRRMFSDDVSLLDTYFPILHAFGRL